ncbi:MAG: hypothetical protein MUF81_16135 [Verrucomicrobia bacterium]|nr:hypothetical protein [Verrucomicrobiota bacterium]
MTGYTVSGPVKFWTGAGPTSGNWNDPQNWSSGVLPGNGDILIFPAGAARPVNTNDLTGLVLSQIQFQGSNYVIYGNAFTLTNSLGSTNASGTNVLYPSLTLSNVDITMNVGAGANLVLRGALSGTVGVTKSGGGTLTYLGSTANTYAGPTLVNEGTLELGRGLGRCIPG